MDNDIIVALLVFGLVVVLGATMLVQRLVQKHLLLCLLIFSALFPISSFFFFNTLTGIALIGIGIYLALIALIAQASAQEKRE